MHPSPTMDAAVSRPPPRLKRWLLRALLALFSCLIALIAAEILLRRGGSADPFEGFGMYVHDPLLGWALAPGARTRQSNREYDVAVRINDQGFRADREYSHAPALGATRVVAVGDSFTFGQGVEIQEAWPSILERRLGKADVVNLGVPGYGVDQQLLMLESRGLSYQPDIVVLGLHTPDVFRNTNASHGRYAKPLFRIREDDLSLELTNVPTPPPGTPVPPPDRGPLHRSRLFQMVFTRLERHGAGEVWEVTEAILRRMADTASQAEARLVVLLLPPQYAVYGGALESKSQAHTTGLIAAILRGQGIEHLDLTPALAKAAEKNPAERLFYPGDGHFTAAGNRVVAEELLRRLGKR
ncbi:MAG TPA: GDSL-type esterase/lipase family protein [Thermoanaerobaculia bacterium]